MLTLGRSLLLAGVGIAVAGGALVASLGRTASADDQAKGKASDPAVERARREVQMLDALYKTAVVSLTDRYRRGQPAIMVAKDVFKAMEQGGYHSARLVDASDAPLGEHNNAETAFEKRAVKAMQSGETYLEEVVGEGKDRHFLAATVVPAVHPRCAECHGVKEGDLLGFIRYDIPLGKD